jgi:TRAP-type C4-dicarboxylate transport system permease large subunit
LAGITPPFGDIIFALNAAVPKMTLAQLYRPAWLFVWFTVTAIVLFTVCPGSSRCCRA